jgi:hypothetical protein
MGEIHPIPYDLEKYRLNVPCKRGMLIKPLVFGPDPAPMTGESLLGLLARTAERNSFTRAFLQSGGGLRKVFPYTRYGTLRFD